MERGRIVLSGTGETLLNDPQVQHTYLGQHAAPRAPAGAAGRDARPEISG